MSTEILNLSAQLLQGLLANPERYRYIAEQVKSGHLTQEEATQKNVDKAVRMAEALLDKASKWPWCTRIPNISGWYIITDISGQVYECFFNQSGHWEGQDGVQVTPLAWMPMPKPFVPEKQPTQS